MTSWGGPGPSPTSASVQATSPLVNAASPGARTPSSLVTRILTCTHAIGARPMRVWPSPVVHAPVTGLPSPLQSPWSASIHPHAAAYAHDLGRLAHRAAVAHRSRAPGGHRLRGRGHPAHLQRARAPGDRRLRGGRMVALGTRPDPRALAQPAGRRALRVQRRARPGRPRRAGAPQRHPRPRALDALEPADPAPEPALTAAAPPPHTRVPVLAPARCRISPRARRPDRHDDGAVA